MFDISDVTTTVPPVSAQDRQRIVRDYRLCLDYAGCAEKLGVRRSTAHSIVRRYQEIGGIELAAPPREADTPMTKQNAYN